MRIAILGSRGIPASYSGFETSIQEISTRLSKRGIRTTVYCRSNLYKERVEEFKGVNLLYLTSINTKHLDTITHTFLSVIHSLFNKYDVIILYGVGNAIFIPIYRVLSIPVISVVDGADWRRKKWGYFARLFLKINSVISAQFSTNYIVDNKLLADKYSKIFKKPPVYITYGAQEYGSNIKSILAKYKLKEQEYIIFIGRFEKEKGLEFLIENYHKIKTKIKLVVVGGNNLDKEYEDSIKDVNDDRIIFPGFLYGPEYESLLKNALFYVSCSILEGTSPSLLTAMSLNGFALVSEIEENVETLKGSCDTFKPADKTDFNKKLVYYLERPQLVNSLRDKTKSIIKEYYDWNIITDKYEKLIRSI